MHRMGHPGYDDDSQYPDDEPTRAQKLARRAGRLADVVVNRKHLTVAQKDEVVVVLRECERELLEGKSTGDDANREVAKRMSVRGPSPISACVRCGGLPPGEASSAGDLCYCDHATTEGR